ncbi:unnamed protein product [Arctogadus glacialis]
MSSRPRPGLALLLLCFLLPGSEQICPSVCMCTADTLSCASSGLRRLPRNMPSSPLTLDLSYNHMSMLVPRGFASMPRLETLRVTHNQLTSLGPDVFYNASGLRHLDLSSNKLRVMEQHYFQGLWRLEELVLFNNQITQVEGATLNGLRSLKKVYFSLNQITDFPFFSIREHSHPFLTMLDLSSNRLTTLPWEDVKALPGTVQRGLFLHNNTLLCDCSLYGMFWHWEMKGFDSLKDFYEDYMCTVRGDSRSIVHFLRQRRVFQNCTVGKSQSLQATVLLSNLVIFEGERASMDCYTSLGTKDPWYVWLTPGQGYMNQSAANDSLISVFANGTLEIPAARLNDSGLYVCTAVDQQQMVNATREFNLTVVRPPAETFSTGYTTLLGCAVTTVLILMYLYLTPCQCGCCSPPGPPADPVSVYSPAAYGGVPPAGGPEEQALQRGQSRRVAFLEPLMIEQNQNGRTKGNETTLPVQWCWDNAVMNETAFLDGVLKWVDMKKQQKNPSI